MFFIQSTVIELYSIHSIVLLKLWKKEKKKKALWNITKFLVQMILLLFFFFRVVSNVNLKTIDVAEALKHRNLNTTKVNKDI